MITVLKQLLFSFEGRIPRSRYWLGVLLVAAPMLLAGCMVETQDGDSMTYTYPFWVPLATTCLGVAVGVAGVRLPDLDDLLRWIFWGGALLLLLASPWLLTYSVTVDPEGFSISGLLEDRTVRFDDVTGDVPAAVEFGRVAAAPVNTLRQQTHRCQEISVCF